MLEQLPKSTGKRERRRGQRRWRSPALELQVAQVRPRRQVGEGSDEGGLPTFGVLRATLGPHSRAGVSISMEGVGGRTAWSLGCDAQL